MVPSVLFERHRSDPSVTPELRHARDPTCRPVPCRQGGHPPAQASPGTARNGAVPTPDRRSAKGRLSARTAHVGRVATIVGCSAVLAAILASCSSGTTGATGTTGSTAPRPVGPAGVVSGPLTGGSGISLVSGNPGPSPSSYGYTEAEYAVSGTATAYRAASGLPADGRGKPKTKA